MREHVHGKAKAGVRARMRGRERKRRRGRGREDEIACPSSGSLHSRGWVGAETGFQIQVSHMGGRSPVTSAITYCLPGSTLARN